MVFSKRKLLFFFNDVQMFLSFLSAKAVQILEARHSTLTYCAREIFFPSTKAISKDNAPGVTKWNLRKRSAAMAVQSKSLLAGETIHFADSYAKCVRFINGKISIEDSRFNASPEHAAVQFQRACR